MRNIAFLMMLFLGAVAGAQTTITGKVVSDSNEPIPLANLSVQGTGIGTNTNFDGEFSITLDREFPIKFIVSSIGYESTTILVDSDNIQDIVITLNEGADLDVVIISASRAPERIFESPVSVEYFGAKDIKTTTAADFYGGLENLKGVDINTGSLTNKSVNTRGFATFANTRFVQLVDGMDNSSPALNIVLGNLLGMSELDINSIELLPGASSALYGANAFNGILFMTSKNPFDHPGISGYAKSGITSQEAAGNNGFYDVGVRLAHAFSEKFAAKANVSYLTGTDWFASNTTNVLNPATDRSDPNYDGINVYGDEVSQNMQAVGQQLVSAGIIPAAALALIPNEEVSRTGYDESDLNEFNAESLKFDASLHYRPFADDFEIIYNGKLSQGTTIFQDSNRFSINNFTVQQHKLEVKNNNFFVRGYITLEDGGDSYDTRFTGININRSWKSDPDWFGQYVGGFVGAKLANPTITDAQAHAFARNDPDQGADVGRLVPGTVAFQNAFDQVTSDPDIATGSKFQDNNQIKHVDANYNFKEFTEILADVQVGGSYRQYVLDSDGTIFTDFDGPIDYSEFGAYVQAQRKLAEESLKITASVRYDKSELFDGNFSPRLSLGYTLGQNKNHNIRASAQTGFRNPTTQNLYLGLDVGRAIVVGSAPDNLDRDVREFNLNIGGTASVTGRQAYENSYTVNSVQAFSQSGNPADLEIANPDIVKPEKVTAFELGYRTEINNLVIDLSGYYNQYKDFISTKNVIVPLYGAVGDGSAVAALATNDFEIYQTTTNSAADINSIGATLGLSTKVFDNYDLGFNYTFAEQDFEIGKDPEFRTGFNTPKHKIKASFGNDNLFENFGFNTNFRWSDSYFWEASFGDGEIPSFSVFDAQINYKIPAIKSVLKVGGTNLGGDEYFTAFGSGFIGSQYYIGITINNF